MHPLDEIRRLVAVSSAPAEGEIVRVQGKHISVATNRGVAIVTRAPGDATGYAPGDRVRLRGDVVSGRLSVGTNTYPV